jgi:dipeptidyl aminopeptidase/acylaminoacyl peptidase
VRPTAQKDRPSVPFGTNVWIASTETREVIDVGRGVGASWMPVWSPDGRFVAFYSDRDGADRLWVWERATGRTRRIADVVISRLFGIEPVVWTPDSRQVLALIEPERDLTTTRSRASSIATASSTRVAARESAKVDRTAADRTAADPTAADRAAADPTAAVTGAKVTIFRSHARSESSNATVAAASSAPQTTAQTAGERAAPIFEAVPWPGADLAAIDLASGAVRRVVRRAYVRAYRLSPDGMQIAYTANPTAQRDTQQFFYDLAVAPLAGGTPRVLVSRIGAASHGRPMDRRSATLPAVRSPRATPSSSRPTVAHLGC